MKRTARLVERKKYASPTIRKTVRDVFAVKAMLANHAVSTCCRIIYFIGTKKSNFILLFNKQNGKAASNSFKMVSRPVACTPSIQMAANQCKCCVT